MACHFWIPAVSLGKFRTHILKEAGHERLAIFGYLHDRFHLAKTGEPSTFSTFQSWSILGPALQAGIEPPVVVVVVVLLPADYLTLHQPFQI